MRNMLEQIRTTWGLKNAPRNGEVTDWKLIYHQYDRARRYRRSEATYFFDYNLDAKIDLLFILKTTKSTAFSSSQIEIIVSTSSLESINLHFQK